MQGKTHVLYATVSGVAIASVVGLTAPLGSLEVYAPVALAAASFAAKLPDIDHHRTPMGKALQKLGKIGLLTAAVCLVIAALPSILALSQSGTLMFDFFLIKFFLLIGLPCLLVGLFIMTLKHRGITHDVYFPIGLLFIIHFLSNNLTGPLASVELSLLIGIAYGYINHLFMADIFTKQGLTLLRPLNIKVVLGFVTTGEISETIFTVFYVLICLVITASQVWRLFL